LGIDSYYIGISEFWSFAYGIYHSELLPLITIYRSPTLFTSGAISRPPRQSHRRDKKHLQDEIEKTVKCRISSSHSSWPIAPL